MKHKVILKGGTVFLPDSASFEQLDVLIEDGRIAGLEKDIRASGDASLLSVQGKLVTPGLIDLHMHAFLYGHLLSVDADVIAPRSGTTTFIDGGSTGSLNFLCFREYVIRRAKARILAFLNISAIGQGTDGIEGLNVFENDDERMFHLPSAREIIQKNRDIIVGIKVRAYTGLKSLAPLKAARQLADETGLPIMVHTAPSPPHFREILPYLEEGDIVTHTYHGGKDTILDDAGLVREEVREARRRGILFDVGLDRFHGDFRVMQAALDQGFLPHFISTDLAIPNLRHLTIDLPTTVNKFLALGLPLEDALRCCTVNSAEKIGRKGELGTLRKGSVADIAVFQIEEGEWKYEDYFGNTIEAHKKIVPVMTFLAGVRLDPVERSLETWDCVYKGTSRWHFDF